MKIICDTHIMLFWADRPERLTPKAESTLKKGIAQGSLVCADISLWEIAMLFSRGRLNVHAGVAPEDYISDLLQAMRITVHPITAEIAQMAQDEARFSHKDPADRLIAATALSLDAPLITADEKLQSVDGLRILW